jgi:hypothetical protein
MDRDRGNGRAGPGSGAENPCGRGVGEEQQRQREDQDDRRADEAQPADDHAGHTCDAAGAEHRQLRRRGPGQQVAGRDRVLHLGRRHPAALVDHQLAQQRDVRRRTAEAGDSDPPPFPRHGRERRVTRHGRGRYRAISEKM